MRTSHIALLTAVGLSTVVIAQTTPQTTPDNNMAMPDNSMTPPMPTPDNTQDVPQSPTAPPSTDNATDPAPTADPMMSESKPEPKS